MVAYNHVIKPPSSNVFENYTCRSNVDFEYNYTVKSFIRPKSVETHYVNPHRFVVDGNYVTTDHLPVTWQSDHPERTQTVAQWDVARINHYVIRSVHHYLEKMKRRVDIRESGLGLNLFLHCDRNEHYEAVPTARCDKANSYLYRIQNQINLDILKLMIATCGRGINGEIQSSKNISFHTPSFINLYTTHETIICYVKETGRLCHKDKNKINNLVEPITAFITPYWKDRIFYRRRHTKTSFRYK